MTFRKTDKEIMEKLDDLLEEKEEEEENDKRNTQASAQYHIKIPDKQLCEICTKKKAVARHHPNYKERLKVMFVCARCHRNLHLTNGVNKNG